MGRNRVLCEVHPETKRVIRVLKYAGSAIFLKPEQVLELPKVEAVSQIRRQIFKISKGECRNCGKTLVWPNGFHMHEQKSRGAGGEISIFNSIALCASCHIGGPSSEHGKRSLHFSK